jgi:hypothetical protein
LYLPGNLCSPSRTHVEDVNTVDEGLRNGVQAVLVPVGAASETLPGIGRQTAGLLGRLGAAGKISLTNRAARFMLCQP